MQLVRFLRIQKAKELITNNYDLKLVAGKTGFQSIYHFTRIFKQQEGLPPGAWKDQQIRDICRGIDFEPGFPASGTTGMWNSSMMKALQENLDQRHGNYSLPFLWIHGEEEQTLREMMGAVHNSGIGAVCIEARPHDDFVGPKWWRDMDIILDEARSRQMKVWILDDKHFPTGYAAGRIKSDYPHLRKWYLDKRVIDVVGTGKPAMFFIDLLLKEEESFVALVAYRRSETGVSGEPVNLTGEALNGRLHWKVPPGLWRLFILVQTREGGE